MRDWVGGKEGLGKGREKYAQTTRRMGLTLMEMRKTEENKFRWP